MASQLIEEVTAHAQSDSLEDAREICADGTYFPNSLRIYMGDGHLVEILLESVCVSLVIQYVSNELPFAAGINWCHNN